MKYTRSNVWRVFRGVAQLVARDVWEQITAVPQSPRKVEFPLLFSFFLPFSGEMTVRKES